jgi:uncharacterized Zn finger protein
LPYGGELGSACTCDTWLDPCPHALAVLTQLAWLIQRDPFVLFQLRGLARDELLARLHALSLAGPRSSPGNADAVVHDSTDHRIDQRIDDSIDDLAIAEEAALRAARELSQLLAEPEVS